MALTKPKNAEERKIYNQTALESYKKELEELAALYPKLIDLYYCSHHGMWVVKTEDDEWEEDTKADALYKLSELY